ncbi:hypothetical protein [Actinosynnema sp. NPDC020468]|uniref:hypothetical protein n=1 Tax=Actinosynnema sp. NPDC020468 TaxID=3154488 RepID=UPI0033CD1618
MAATHIRGRSVLAIALVGALTAACGGAPTEAGGTTGAQPTPASAATSSGRAASAKWTRSPEIKLEDTSFGRAQRIGDELWVSATTKGASVVHVFDLGSHALKKTITVAARALAAADNVNAIASSAHAVFLDTGAGNLQGVDRATGAVSAYRQLPSTDAEVKPGKPVSEPDGEFAYALVGDTLFELDTADAVPLRNWPLTDPSGPEVPAGATLDHRVLGAAAGLIWYGVVAKTTPLTAPPEYDHLLAFDPAKDSVRPIDVKADGVIAGPATVGDKAVFAHQGKLWLVDPSKGAATPLEFTRLFADGRAKPTASIDSLSTYGTEAAVVVDGLAEVVDTATGTSSIVPEECDKPKPAYNACLFGSAVLAKDALWFVTPSAITVFTR